MFQTHQSQLVTMLHSGDNQQREQPDISGILRMLPSSAANLVSRRQFVRGLGFGMLGLELPQLLQIQRAMADSSRKKPAKSCIMIFLFGGPSHIDTWDMKPDAPLECRGEFHPIETATPGIQLCEHLPKTARVMEDVALVRGVTIGGHGVGNGDHHADTYYMLTGNRPDRDFFISGIFRKPYPDDFPFIGSIAASRCQTDPELPGIVQCPALSGEVSKVINPGQFAGKLGPNWEPMMARGVLEKPRDFSLPDFALPTGMQTSRVESRRRLLDEIDDFRRAVDRNRTLIDRVDTLHQRAYSLLTSDRTRQAFDIASEPEAVRARYGEDINGQSVLMARRLVEAGVPFVAVHWIGRIVGAGLSWDTHSDNFGQLKNMLLPAFDACYSSLLTDLKDRGLLDETLVIVNAEMGRTPKVGDPRTGGRGTPGRDHWDHCMSALLAGGGVRGGQIYGSSDTIGGYPTGKPVLPEDLARTVYHAMGIADDQLEHRQGDGRPVRLLTDGDVIPVL